MNKTFAALAAKQQDELTRDMLELVGRHNRSGDGTAVIPSTYLEAIIER